MNRDDICTIIFIVAWIALGVFLLILFFGGSAGVATAPVFRPAVQRFDWDCPPGCRCGCWEGKPCNCNGKSKRKAGCCLDR